MWPNGHPVVRLRSGRELDVVALGNSRVTSGHPRLARAFADAAATGLRFNLWLLISGAGRGMNVRQGEVRLWLPDRFR
jgi:hypothetical protein